MTRESALMRLEDLRARILRHNMRSVTILRNIGDLRARSPSGVADSFTTSTPAVSASPAPRRILAVQDVNGDYHMITTVRIDNGLDA